MTNKITEQHIHTAATTETSFKKRLVRKNRRQKSRSDSIAQAEKRDERFFAQQNKDGLDVSLTEGNYNSHNGLYFPGVSLMAYALEAMLLDLQGGLNIMKAIGSAQVAMFSMIGSYYDKLAAAQKEQYKQQMWQAMFGAISSGVGAIMAIGSTGYGIKQWGEDETKLSGLKTTRDNLEAEIGKGSATAQVKDLEEESDEVERPAISVEKVNRSNLEAEIGKGSATAQVKGLEEESDEVERPAVSVKRVNKSLTEKRIDLLTSGKSGPEYEAELQDINDQLAAKKRALKDQNKEIDDHQNAAKQRLNNIQGLQYFGQALSQAGAKTAEAATAAKIGAEMAKQTKADKMKTQINIVYQAADQMYNRMVGNLDQDFQSLGSAAQQAENLKQRASAA